MNEHKVREYTEWKLKRQNSKYQVLLFFTFYRWVLIGETSTTKEVDHFASLYPDFSDLVVKCRQCLISKFRVSFPPNLK